MLFLKMPFNYLKSKNLPLDHPTELNIASFFRTKFPSIYLAAANMQNGNYFGYNFKILINEGLFVAEKGFFVFLLFVCICRLFRYNYSGANAGVADKILKVALIGHF